MGLFDKKYCDICGEKIGLLGNRKLEDGNLCKKCAGKLSPWFSERRKSTVDQIRDQLAYREENKAAVAAFKVTAVYGDSTKIYLDEGARKFLVTGSSSLTEANPDVLDFSQATSCKLSVREMKREEKTKDKDGKPVSYNPPRYNFEYDFTLTIYVDHPYFDDISFRLNRSSVETGRHAVTAQYAFHGDLASYNAPDRVMAYAEPYVSYVLLAKEIEEKLLGKKAAEAPAPAPEKEPAVPSGPMECPHCGATTTPDANGCCEYCGSKIR